MPAASNQAGNTPAGSDTPPEKNGKNRRPRGVNARMFETIQQKIEAKGWTCR